MTEYIQEIIDNLIFYTNKLFLDCYANLQELDDFIESELCAPIPLVMTRDSDSESEDNLDNFDWDIV